MNQHNFPESTVESLYVYYNDSKHLHSAINDNKLPRKHVMVRSIAITAVLTMLGWLLFA